MNNAVLLVAISLTLLAIAFMAHLLDISTQRAVSKGGQGCGIAMGGASGDGTPGQVVIRKCNP